MHPPSEPSTDISPEHRCPEDLDGALSMLYREYEAHDIPPTSRLQLRGKRQPNFQSAMRALLQYPPDRYASLAMHLSCALRHRVHVTCRLERGHWEWMLAPDGNDQAS